MFQKSTFHLGNVLFDEISEHQMVSS